MQFNKPSTATLSKPYAWVHHRDPAFDQDAEGFSAAALDEALAGNHWDRIDRWLKPGRKGPTVFTLKHLSMDVIRGLQGFMSANGFPSAARRACAIALEGIDNKDGKPVPIKQEARDPLFAVSCLSDEVMDLLEYAGCDEGLERGEVVTFIGARALRGAQPPGN